MKESLTNKEVNEQFNKINEILKKNDVPEELKTSLEEYQTTLAVISANSWLPKGLGRKILMLIILIVGISGAMIGNTHWLFILLILPFFSPKIVMKMAIIIGLLKGNK
jgi:2,3-bisphosphoglycerate-independent phosphoglycerate mutase